MTRKGAGVQVPFVILQIRAGRGVVAEKAGSFPGGCSLQKTELLVRLYKSKSQFFRIESKLTKGINLVGFYSDELKRIIETNLQEFFRG